jgi:hypothetical protein
MGIQRRLLDIIFVKTILATIKRIDCKYIAQIGTVEQEVESRYSGI